MQPSITKIQKEIKRLRKFIDQEFGESILTTTEKRMTYLAETILRWSIEDTVDWDLPLEEAINNAKLLLQEIEAKSA